MIEIDKELLKKAYVDKSIEINGTRYDMHTVEHKTGLKIIGLWQDHGAVGSDNWQKLEAQIFSLFSVNDSDVNILLSKHPKHFEENRSNYFTFIVYAVAMVLFPFKIGSLTD